MQLNCYVIVISLRLDSCLLVRNSVFGFEIVFQQRRNNFMILTILFLKFEDSTASILLLRVPVVAVLMF